MLQELTLITEEDRAEALADALIDAGALSVAIEDADADSAAEAPLYGDTLILLIFQAMEVN